MADPYGMRGNPLVNFDPIKLGQASHLHIRNPPLAHHCVERMYREAGIVRHFLDIEQTTGHVRAFPLAIPMNRGSLTTPPSPHDAPAWPPASDSDWTPSGCELALKSSGQAFRVPSQRAPPVSGLPPARAPSRLLLRRPTPCVVKGGARHHVEEGGGHGHSRFTGHSEDDPAADAEA